MISLQFEIEDDCQRLYLGLLAGQRTPACPLNQRARAPCAYTTTGPPRALRAGSKAVFLAVDGTAAALRQAEQLVEQVRGLPAASRGTRQRRRLRHHTL